MNVYERLNQLGIKLPEPPPVGGLYVPVKQAGSLLFVSGQTPTSNGVPMYTGKVGTDKTIEEGQLAARLCILNTLSVLDRYLGDLNKIASVIKVLGFVASAANFNSQPQVINGGSQLLIDIFGENGKHARSALGVNELPCNVTVEIESIFSL